MTQVVKKVGKLVPKLESYQVFIGGSDFGASDVIDIEASLGRPARDVTIVCGASDTLELRFNAQHTLYPEVNDNQFQGDRGGERRLDYDQPRLVLDETMQVVNLGNNEIFTFDKVCRNIQIVSIYGTPEITVT